MTNPFQAILPQNSGRASAQKVSAHPSAGRGTDATASAAPEGHAMSDGAMCVIMFALGFGLSIGVVGPITQELVDDSWRKQIVARGHAAYTVDADGRASWNWIEPQKVEVAK